MMASSISMSESNFRRAMLRLVSLKSGLSENALPRDSSHDLGVCRGQARHTVLQKWRQRKSGLPRTCASCRSWKKGSGGRLAQP